MGNVRAVDGAIIIAYLAIMLILGIVAFFRNKNSSDYFVAGKTLGVFSLAALWMSAWIGGSSIIGTSNDAYNMGISGGWYVFIIGMGCAIFGLTFSGKAKRIGEKYNNLTYTGMISSRYDNKSGAVVLVCSFIAQLGFVASQLVALSSMLVAITGWEPSTCYLVGTIVTIFYSALGGLMAITYTTWIQFILIILGAVVLGIPISAKAIGGFGALKQLPPEYFNMGSYGVSTTLALAVSSIGSFFTAMDSYTRCFAAKDEKTSKKGAVWAGLSVLVICFGATFMGLAAKLLIPEIPAGSSAYASIVAKYFPVGVSGIVMVGALAAIMSTAVAAVNACSAVVAVDVYRDRINKNASEKSIMLLGIVSSAVAGIIGALMAKWRPNIVSLLLLAFTFTTATLFFPTVIGLVWKRPTKKAAFWSMLISLIVVIVWMVGESAGWGPVFEIDSLWPGLLASGLSFFLITFLDKPSEEEKKQAEDFVTLVNAK